MIFFLALLLFVHTDIHAVVSHPLLSSTHKAFVSTGVQDCISLIRALQADFSQVYCIEKENLLIQHAHNIILRYYFNNTLPKHITNYHIYHADPADALLHIIMQINEPIMIVLCSHLPELDHPEKHNSILTELEHIKLHPIKNHTILIDYIHWAGTPYFGNITLNEIINKILEINPEYTITFGRGGHLENEENAVLIAHV